MASNQQPSKPQTKHFQHRILQNGSEFYLNENIADIYFSFGLDDNSSEASVRVPSHKFLLAAESDVFKAMFYGELKENGDIQIKDASCAAFQEFLQYFYLNSIRLTAEHIFEVLHLGHKYNIKKCVTDCVEFLMDLIDDENVCIGLYSAILQVQKKLMKKCEKRIIVNTAAIVKSASFMECDKIVLAHILCMDLLSCSEVELFEACMSWVRSKSGQEVVSREAVETHLGELYYQIRFASMTMTDLHNLTDKYESVLQQDFFTISKLINKREDQSEKFNTSSRQIEWNADAVIKCSFENGNAHVYNLFKTESLIFSTNEPLLLGGITCGSIVNMGCGNLTFDLKSDLSADVEVLEFRDLSAENVNSLLKMTANFKSANTDIVLSQPILARPGFFYKISIGPFIGEHCFYSDILKTEMRIQSNTVITLHKCTTASTPEDVARHGKEIGLIWALVFNNI